MTYEHNGASQDHFDMGHAEGLLNMMRASHWSSNAMEEHDRSYQALCERTASKIKQGEFRQK